MAKNQVTLTFAGDSSDLERAFDNVGVAAKSMDDDVSRSIDRTTTTIREAGGSFRDMQDRFDGIEQGAMGFRDTITGVQDGMSGLNILSGQASDEFNNYSAKVKDAESALDALKASGTASDAQIQAATDNLATMKTHLGELEAQTGSTVDGLLLMGQGVGDLASGAANLIVPLLALNATTAKTAITWVTSHASMAASSVATAASAIASWVATAAASIANAAVVAASWLLAFAPVIIVVAIVVGLVILIIKNWDTIKEVIQAGWNFVKDITSKVWDAIKSNIQMQINLIKSVVTGVWNGIQAVTSAVWGAITGSIRTQINLVTGIFNSFKTTVTNVFSAIGNAITAPIRSALDGIRSAWNNTIGGKGISIPKILGFGGATFTIPKLADGGIVSSPTLAMIGEGNRSEAVVPLNSRGQIPGGGGHTVIELRDDGTPIAKMLVELLRKEIRNQGGGVVQVLG